MKLPATKKIMKENFSKIISIGYCDAQYLLSEEVPVAYSRGLYGWACDYYDIDRVLISTGYRPLKNKNINANYPLICEYEQIAKKAERRARPGILRELIKKLDNM